MRKPTRYRIAQDSYEAPLCAKFFEDARTEYEVTGNVFQVVKGHVIRQKMLPIGTKGQPGDLRSLMAGCRIEPENRVV
jgi:hypothetical protein